MNTRVLTTLCLFLALLPCFAQKSAKREFRGAWIQTVHQGHYAKMDEATMKKYFIDMLDALQEANINAILFQMRPSADAFYLSEIEPASRYLTGKQGVWQSKPWDPAAFLIEEAHKRNMEFHAWLNPYRVTASKYDVLCDSHIFHQHPSWFVEYDGKKYFDPGQPPCRKFYRKVIMDIVNRYDVDAIHMDDYFYPYPVAGKDFPDDASFMTYHQKQGFNKNQRDDWRRNNVDILIKSIHDDIAKAKPWVRFGISPFGIYRNKSSWDQGSETNGLENYDALFADVLRWTSNGWIDYVVPQLYWEIGHKAADYTTLIKWWNQHHHNVPLYIGQSISRSLDDNKNLTNSHHHLDRKIDLSRELEHVEGNCFWYGYQIVNNNHGIRDVLKQRYHAHPALIPSYQHIDTEAPERTKRPKARWTEKGYFLQWKAPEEENPMQKASYYCIYQFPKGTKKDFNDPQYLIGTTRETSFLLPYTKSGKRYDFYVTVVDRMHNESKQSRRQRVKL